jgi:hypothetical protein
VKIPAPGRFSLNALKTMDENPKQFLSSEVTHLSSPFVERALGQ